MSKVKKAQLTKITAEKLVIKDPSFEADEVSIDTAATRKLNKGENKKAFQAFMQGLVDRSEDNPTF